METIELHEHEYDSICNASNKIRVLSISFTFFYRSEKRKREMLSWH